MSEHGPLFARRLYYAERELHARLAAAPQAEHPALRLELARLGAYYDAREAEESSPPPRYHAPRRARPDVIVGMPAPGGKLRAEAPRGANVLISANALWDRRRRRFRLPNPPPYYDQALDSAGYVAMVRYGGYPWAVDEYIDFAAVQPWIWYSAMDYCCEPDVASDRAEVTKRVALTAATLRECRDRVTWLQDSEGIGWATDPMPILQGWRPDDYRRSVDLTAEVLQGHWPDTIGLGSVCRRKLNGPDGIYALLGQLDGVLPPHVQLHLFGVKSGALERLADNPRVCSVDSCAWDFAARVAARETGASRTAAYRGKFMRDWYGNQQRAIERGQESERRAPRLL